MRLICFYATKIVIADKVFANAQEVHEGFLHLLDVIASRPDNAALTPLGYSAVPDQALPGRYDKTR